VAARHVVVPSRPSPPQGRASHRYRRTGRTVRPSARCLSPGRAALPSPDPSVRLIPVLTLIPMLTLTQCPAPAPGWPPSSAPSPFAGLAACPFPGAPGFSPVALAGPVAGPGRSPAFRWTPIPRPARVPNDRWRRAGAAGVSPVLAGVSHCPDVAAVCWSPPLDDRPGVEVVPGVAGVGLARTAGSREPDRGRPGRPSRARQPIAAAVSRFVVAGARTGGARRARAVRRARLQRGGRRV